MSSRLDAIPAWISDALIDLLGIVFRVRATGSLDFGSVAAAGYADLTLTATGAVLGDMVFTPGFSILPTAGLSYRAFVSAADTVTVRAINNSAGAIDPAATVFSVTVFASTR